jgi:hypothetical protein
MTAFAEGRPLGKIRKSKQTANSTIAQLLPEEQAILRFLKQEWLSNRN